MSKSNTFENDWLKLIFHGTGIANLADNASGSPLTSLYLALHTADPDEAGDASTNECAYTGYARQAVTRDSGGFTISGNTVTLAVDVDFPIKTGGSDEVATHFSVTVAVSGSTKILYSGTVTDNINIEDGTIPRLDTGTTITED